MEQSGERHSAACHTVTGTSIAANLVDDTPTDSKEIAA